MEKKEKIEEIKISQASIAQEIRIQRSAISKVAINNDYVTTTSTLEALCRYFDCKIEDLIKYIPED
ncbi:helix-turn-helix domain-containing protein [Vibrio alfacsensis]|uniref:helix-turn-helix domain-containing protein n=1 Tax=Vibrio alfacsensis TaxID=1074311 RepID=UPI001C802475